LSFYLILNYDAQKHELKISKFSNIKFRETKIICLTAASTALTTMQLAFERLLMCASNFACFLINSEENRS